MKEVDHTQSGGEIGGTNNIRGHHWDECHIRPIKVPIEYGKRDQQGERVKEGHEHTAEALHANRHHVAQHAISLQTPRRKEIYQYWDLNTCRLNQTKKYTLSTYFLSMIQPKVMLPTMPLTPNMDIRKAACLCSTPTLRA